MIVKFGLNWVDTTEGNIIINSLNSIVIVRRHEFVAYYFHSIVVGNLEINGNCWFDGANTFLARRERRGLSGTRHLKDGSPAFEDSLLDPTDYPLPEIQTVPNSQTV